MKIVVTMEFPPGDHDDERLCSQVETALALVSPEAKIECEVEDE